MYKLPDVQVVSLAQVKKTIMTLISTAKVMVFSIALIAILIAIVGVMNTILMSVMERCQEIGILKAMGAMAWDIFRLIWIETVILCVCGGLARLRDGPRSRPSSPRCSSGSSCPTRRAAGSSDRPRSRSSTLGVVTVIGLLSGIYPAWRAGSVRPLEPSEARWNDERPARSHSIEAEHLRRIYRRGSEEIPAVDGVSLDRQGEFVAFVGPSGSGKTTLINILGCLDNPTSGRLALGGGRLRGGGRFRRRS